MMRRGMGRMLWLAPLAIVGFALFITLGGWAVRELWNWLLPPLFGWHVITFWQAIALLALCRILFGGLGLHGGPRSRMRERMRDRMAERWGGLSSEERDHLRQIIRERFGTGPSAGEAPKS